MIYGIIAVVVPVYRTQRRLVLLICPKCLSRIPATSKFCPECGADLRPKQKHPEKLVGRAGLEPATSAS